ncbi:MAG: hypothetical protein MJ151_01790 [Lachnospiraceae bacterium]|nr:hypothetical protein [Lachnospiraceae bacterium]
MGGFSGATYGAIMSKGGGGGKTTEDIVTNKVDGNMPANTNIPKGTDLTSYIKMRGVSDLAPIVNITSPTTVLFKAGTTPTITLSGNAQKTDTDITKIELYKGNELIDTIISGTSFSHVFDDIASNVVLKAKAYDATNTGEASKQITFVNASYKGTVDSPVEFLSTNCEQKIAYTGSMIIPIYRYPASLGNITKIYDSQGVDDYTSAFTKTTETIDGVSYICFVKKEPADGMTYWFKKQ